MQKAAMKADTDAIAHAANLLVCIGSLLTAGSALNGAAAVTTGFLSWRAISERLKPTNDNLADALRDELEGRLSVPEVDAEMHILFPQMLEASLPEPVDIVAMQQDGRAVAQLMAQRFTEPEHMLPSRSEAFISIAGAALNRLFNDPGFNARLAPAFRKRLLEDASAIKQALEELIDQFGSFAGVLEKTEALASASRNQLEALASRFEIDRAYDLTNSELLDLLYKRAEDYRNYKDQIDQIDEQVSGLGNRKAAAKDAADKLDFAAVEDLLSKVHKTELNDAWKTASLRADNALLRGRTQQAFDIVLAASNSFTAIDPVQASRRIGDDSRLYWHAVRYGGDGFALDIRMKKHALNVVKRQQTPLTAKLLHLVARSEKMEGCRKIGPPAIGLLHSAFTHSKKSYDIACQVGDVDVARLSLATMIGTLWEFSRRNEIADKHSLLNTALEYCNEYQKFAFLDQIEFCNLANWYGLIFMQKGIVLDNHCSPDYFRQALIAFEQAEFHFSFIDSAFFDEYLSLRQYVFKNNIGYCLGFLGENINGYLGEKILHSAIAVHKDVLSLRERDNDIARASMTRSYIGFCEFSLYKKTRDIKYLYDASKTLSQCREVFSNMGLEYDLMKSDDTIETIRLLIADQSE